ncbi:MAG: single- stranded DNA-binding family protein [Sulfolobales archaeon]
MVPEGEEKHLSTGYIWAATYADKIRRTIYAQLKDLIKENKALREAIPRDVAQLNSALYRLLVEDLKIEKTDLVRIRISYRIKEDRIEWLPETLTVEAFKRIPEEEIIKHVAKLKSSWKEMLAKGITYTVESLGITEDEDVVYVLKLGDSEYGSVLVTVLNDELFIKRGVMIYPNPILFEKIRVKIANKKPEEAISEVIRDLDNIKNISPTAIIKYISEEEALKQVNTLRSRVKAPPIEAPSKLPEEE